MATPEQKIDTLIVDREIVKDHYIKSKEIVYKIDFENNRQVQFVTQSFAVQFTEPAPYDAKMQNENTSIVYRVSGELELGSTSNIIRAYRGNYELTNKPSGFTGAEIDAYGSSSYEYQCTVEVHSCPGYIHLDNDNIVVLQWKIL